MLSKLYNLAAALSLSTMLALSAFAGYLKFTGHLTGERLDQISAVLRGELDPSATSQPADEGTAENSALEEGHPSAAAPEHSPDTPPAGGHASPSPAAAAPDQVKNAPHAPAEQAPVAAHDSPTPAHSDAPATGGSAQPPRVEPDDHGEPARPAGDAFADKLRSDWSAHDIDARQRLLERALRLMSEERTRLAAQREAADQEAARKKAAEEQEALFQKELRAVKSLSPAQAKARVLKLWKKKPADAVRLLQALDSERVEAILELLSATSQEAEIQALIRDRLAESTEGEASEGSGPTDGAAAP